MEGKETTFVSAFIANANTRSDRSIEDYINYGKKILYAPVKKIIFFDETALDKIPSDCINENIKIIPIKREDNYLYQYKNNITNFALNTNTPNKDTLDYVLLICNKTEYVRKAIELNPFNSEQFIWIDFGINHICNKDNDDFEKAITAMNYKRYESVRIASLWSMERYEYIYREYNYDIYKDIFWVFAGGIFGGNTESLLKFADLTKDKCIKVINEKSTLMWEANIWLLVYLENKELLSLYQCDDHNITMLTDY